MTISKENKIKVFAQYIGQEVALCNPGYAIDRTPRMLSKHLIEHPNMVLVLKPLENITVADAIEVCRMVVSRNRYPITDYQIKRHNTSIEVKLDNNYFTESVFIGFSGNVWTTVKHPRYGNNVFQFLTAQGYDQMQYLLDGQTLQEAGMAIYETRQATEAKPLL